MAKRTRKSKKKKKKKARNIPKYRFRVMSGRHYERTEDGQQVCYQTGETFMSYRRLDKIFGGKLRYLGLEKPKEEEEPDVPDTEDEDVDIETEDEDTDEDEDEEEDEDEGEEEGEGEGLQVVYKMKHRGGGRWIVVPVHPETDEIVGDPVHDGYLNKAKALEILESLD
jgi:hypothetical protein